MTRMTRVNWMTVMTRITRIAGMTVIFVDKKTKPQIYFNNNGIKVMTGQRRPISS